MAARKQLTPWFGHDRTLAQQMMGLDRLFAEIEGKDVLDVGCAEGLLSIECAKAGADVVGIEIRAQAVHDAMAAVNRDPIARQRVSVSQADANFYDPLDEFTGFDIP